MAGRVYHFRTVGLVLILLSVGFMRRGPKMYFPPPRLGTGFGLSSEHERESKEDPHSGGGYGKSGDQNDDDDRRKGVVIKLAPAQEIDDPLDSAASAVTIERQRLRPPVPEEPKSNVFDYHNSSMINFVLLTYVSSSLSSVFIFVLNPFPERAILTDSTPRHSLCTCGKSSSIRSSYP